MFRLLFKILKLVGFLLAVVILVAAAYLGFLSLTEYRPEETASLTIEENKSEKIEIGQTLTALTYNIQFGASDVDFSYFAQGGASAHAKDKETVVANMEGAMETVREIAPDFGLFQAVDRDATRSFNVNEYEMIQNALTRHGYTYAENLQVKWIAYPFSQMLGAVDSGLVTASGYNLSEANRVVLPCEDSWPLRLFTPDHCMIVSRVPTENGRELVLINLQLSLYEQNGKLREEQLDALQTLMETEYKNGNYVIVGGDWGCELTASAMTDFPATETKPDWLEEIPDSFAPEGFRFAIDTAVPTSRTMEKPYTEGVNYQTITDGFMVSDNVEIISVSGIDTGYQYSSHNPVALQFRLK